MIKKITTGFVIQTFDDNGKFVDQEFVAGDDVQIESETGVPLFDEDVGLDLDNLYERFKMYDAGLLGLVDSAAELRKRLDNA